MHIQHLSFLSIYKERTSGAYKPTKFNALQLFSAQSMQMQVWSCGITLFYLLFSMTSLFPLCFSVYMSMSAFYITITYLSIPLEVSVSGFLSVVFSFNFLHFLLKINGYISDIISPRVYVMKNFVCQTKHTKEKKKLKCLHN